MNDNKVLSTFQYFTNDKDNVSTAYLTQETPTKYKFRLTQQTLNIWCFVCTCAKNVSIDLVVAK